MVPISKDFGVPLTEVAIVFTLTLWMRCTIRSVGAACC
jgi:hypothetical protein